MSEELDPEIKKRVDVLIAEDKAMMENVVHCAFLAGMQLAMRICRNRAKDCKAIGKDDQEALNCYGMIRITQVEIGTGRMSRPTFTQDELDEMDRIA